LDLPHSPCPLRSLNGRLEGVTPHAVVGEDGRPKSSWRCPSLLKAIDLMLYHDETSSGKIQECQAPGCPNYFLVGPRSRESMYCPPPPGKKQSPCASRASSRMHRERRRRSPDTIRTPLQTQYPALPSKPEEKTRLRYARFAIIGNTVQRIVRFPKSGPRVLTPTPLRLQLH
jgi:hypothetical protein